MNKKTREFFEFPPILLFGGGMIEITAINQKEVFRLMNLIVHNKLKNLKES